jgi:hypothetical protein
MLAGPWRQQPWRIKAVRFGFSIFNDGNHSYPEEKEVRVDAGVCTDVFLRQHTLSSLKAGPNVMGVAVCP